MFLEIIRDILIPESGISSYSEMSCSPRDSSTHFKPFGQCKLISYHLEREHRVKYREIEFTHTLMLEVMNSVQTFYNGHSSATCSSSHIYSNNVEDIIRNGSVISRIYVQFQK